MTRLLLLSAMFLASAANAQPEADLMRVRDQLTAMRKAVRDQERDSLSLLVKQELRAMLERPDAMERPFEGIPMSWLEAPDGAFRIFTWNVAYSNGTHRFEGLLVVSGRRGNIIYDLQDATATFSAPELPETGPERWYGALYYQLATVRKGGKTYYTLLGWKGHSSVETRKVIEVLHLKGGRPRFGAPLFGTGRLRAMRQVFGFGFQATMMLRHEPEQDRIVLDHLSPGRADMEGQWAYYGPDLSYDAYVWDKGTWRFERDIDLRDTRKDGRPFNAPPPAPKP